MNFEVFIYKKILLTFYFFTSLFSPSLFLSLSLSLAFSLSLPLPLSPSLFLSIFFYLSFFMPSSLSLYSLYLCLLLCLILFLVSRGISKATDMAAASLELRDEMNACRESFLAAQTGILLNALYEMAVT